MKSLAIYQPFLVGKESKDRVEWGAENSNYATIDSQEARVEEDVDEEFRKTADQG